MHLLKKPDLNHAVNAILHFFVEVTWLFKINLYFHEAFNQLLASSSRKCEMTRLSSRVKRTQASRSSSLSKERYFSKVLKWEVNCALADRCNCDEKWILARKKSKHILSWHFTSPNWKEILSKFLFLPMPTFDEGAFYHRQTQRSSHNLGHLSVRVHIGSGERRDVDWVANWLIARWIDDVSQSLWINIWTCIIKNTRQKHKRDSTARNTQLKNNGSRKRY